MVVRRLLHTLDAEGRNRLETVTLSVYPAARSTHHFAMHVTSWVRGGKSGPCFDDCSPRATGSAPPWSGSRPILGGARLVRMNLLHRRDGDRRQSRRRQGDVERRERRLPGFAPQPESVLEPLVAGGQGLTLRLRRCGVAAIEVIVQRTQRLGD